MNKKGFTLIELLVVIAIIGILSGIVLTSLSSARNKAKVASAEGSLTSMRSQAELYNTSGTYPTDLCTNTNGLNSLMTAVNGQVGNTAAIKCGVKSTATAWAVAADLTGLSAGTYFCVDSTGYSGTISSTQYNGVNGSFTGSINAVNSCLTAAL